MTAIAVQRLRSDRTVPIVGIALGILAFWLTLPPVASRSWAVPVLLGIVAVLTGIVGITHGKLRLGWGAVASGLLGIILGLLALQSGVNHLKLVFSWGGLIAATLVYATPLTYAALGGMFSERAGVVNIALEGMMLVGAFFGIWGAVTTGNWILGLLIGMGMGGVFALVHAIWAIHLRADQIVGGTAINFLALGITGYFFIQIYGNNGTPDLSNGHWFRGESIPDVHIPGLQGGGFFDQVLGGLNLMIWLSFAALILSYVVLFKTSLGLRLRAVGEHPRAADTVGIDVYRTRYVAVIVSGMLAAMGGAYLSIGFVHSFNQNMTEGRGFIALAALIFGKWRPFGAFAAALLFGFSSALATQVPAAYTDSSVSVLSSGSLFQILPYVLTLIAVAGVIGRSIGPAAAGRPYVKQ
ncbi:MAG TPA: ABC transporter permease [Gaiellaceae bacterium]|nr:ABC transporter permease [Gaiellaceae bacterium]